MRVLVTGGAGYIGSHTCLELLRKGHHVHVIDNLQSGCLEALKRVKRLSNRSLRFSNIDVRDASSLQIAFEQFKPEVVIHFAGLKSISDSLAFPAKYHDVNVVGTSALLAAMDQANCQKIVFSSSATVYGDLHYLPCDEDHPSTQSTHMAPQNSKERTW